MVGTATYMPPEQAGGGDVTASSDLYSLGAMLYEMVAGRPPFLGDDAVTVVSQHINTPPVSPAWHNADVPPALDTLILSRRFGEREPSNSLLGTLRGRVPEVHTIGDCAQPSVMELPLIPPRPETTGGGTLSLGCLPIRYSVRFVITSLSASPASSAAASVCCKAGTLNARS